MADTFETIETLRAEVERLRAALKPFACDCEGEAICIGECMHRNARAAIRSLMKETSNG